MNAKSWLAWLFAASVVVLSSSNPAVTLAALAAMSVVGASSARRAPEGRTVWLFLKIGLVCCALRILLFGLTGHVGNTTLVHLPAVAMPRWLGGFTAGGIVTAEEIAQQAADGARIAAFLVCFGVFLSAVETSRVLRLVPRFLFEAGLVVSIALAFIPSMMRTAADVRDAQRLRGHRFRGMRALRPLVVPVLAGALERSLELAASMECRGYGRASKRTRLRAERMDPWDRALCVISATIAIAAVAARNVAGAHWSAFPELSAPSLDARLYLPALALVAPVLLYAHKRARLRKASEDIPIEVLVAS